MSFEDQPLFHRILDLSPFSKRELHDLIYTAPKRYETHNIEKRHGRGQREISQPAAEVKFLQRLLLEHELQDVPIHDAAIAYRPGKSIKEHAEPHAPNKYLMKLDFKDFFPSLTAERINKVLSRVKNYSEAEFFIVSQVLCKKRNDGRGLALSVGAPSSPSVSNFVMFEFDRLVSEWCNTEGAHYTRYADDLAISTNVPKLLDACYNYVVETIEGIFPGELTLNESKTTNVSKKNRRFLTGLILSNDGKVSVGRDKKRMIRAQLHAVSQGQWAGGCSSLRGELAFVRSVDPEFVDSLLARYGYKKISHVVSAAE